MARGNDAKAWITSEICKNFGDKVVKIDGSKIYINAQENGEVCQICLNMTCPKTPVESDGAIAVPVVRASGGVLNFEEEPAAPAPPPITEITAEEEQNIRDLMARLGL